MADLVLTAWYLQIPIVIGGVLHMMIVTRDWLPALKKPICAKWFGANKTWRGVILMPLLTMAGAACLIIPERWLGDNAIFGNSLLSAGLAAGFGYILAELPNSLVKRRLGIAPGEVPARHRQVFVITDQIDSGIGVALAYLIHPGLPWEVCLTYAATFPVTALVVKRLLFMCRLKKSAT